jgi:hypothetical protein
MREIDCAHYRSLQMLLWSWFRKNIDFFDFFYTNTWFEKTFLHQQISVLQWQSSGLLVTKVAVSNPACSQIFLHGVFVNSFFEKTQKNHKGPPLCFCPKIWKIFEKIRGEQGKFLRSPSQTKTHFAPLGRRC